MLHEEAAVVTGSTSGVDYRSARAFAGAAAGRALNSFRREVNEGKVEFVGADMSRRDAVGEPIAAAEACFGRVLPTWRWSGSPPAVISSPILPCRAGG